MIASRIGVIVAWVLAGVLAATLLLGGDREAPSDRTLVPGLDPSSITALEWSGPRGFRIERDAGSSTGWRWIDPSADADRQAIEDVIAALRGAQWHRRAEPAAAGALGITLVIEAPTGQTTLAIRIAIGQPLGDEQRWLVVGEHALLVDAWVARALAPDPVVFRVRPFARVAQAAQLEVGSFQLSGTPRRITKLAGMPIELYANATAVDQLERALAEISIVAIPNGKVPVDTNYRGTRIAFDGKLAAVEAGMCPVPDRAHHAIFGPAIGPSCVTEQAWQRMLAAAAVFDLPTEPAAREATLAALVDRRPAPIEPSTVTFPGGETLELGRRPRVAGLAQGPRDADPERVAELLAVLSTPAEPVALPAVPPSGTLVVTAAGVAIELVLYRSGIVARTQEPIGLRVGEGSLAILARGAAAYVDRTLWSEEPTTVRSLQLGGVVYTRGAVVGEWTRSPAGTVDAAAVEQLVGLLAVPRARGDAVAPADPLPVILTIVPPAGARSERKLLLGDPARCAATVPSGVIALEPQICVLARRLAY